jgi:hypothetical protein
MVSLSRELKEVRESDLFQDKSLQVRKQPVQRSCGTNVLAMFKEWLRGQCG